jgi:hypothetical protein
MLFNATTEFSSFCVMSNIPPPPLGDPQYQTEGLNETGIFIGAGFYDAAFQNARNTQDRLTAAGISTYLSHFPQNGAHQWSTWQDILWYYARYGLWHQTPYITEKASTTVYDMSGGVPY